MVSAQSFDCLKAAPQHPSKWHGSLGTDVVRELVSQKKYTVRASISILSRIHLRGGRLCKHRNAVGYYAWRLFDLSKNNENR